jgi:hypothetical protein
MWGLRRLASRAGTGRGGSRIWEEEGLAESGACSVDGTDKEYTR